MMRAKAYRSCRGQLRSGQLYACNDLGSDNRVSLAGGNVYCGYTPRAWKSIAQCGLWHSNIALHVERCCVGNYEQAWRMGHACCIDSSRLAHASSTTTDGRHVGFAVNADRDILYLSFHRRHRQRKHLGLEGASGIHRYTDLRRANKYVTRYAQRSCDR